MTLILKGTDNSVSDPAVQGGTAGTTTGVYYPASNKVGIATNGTVRATFDQTGSIVFGGATQYAYTENAGSLILNNGTIDTPNIQFATADSKNFAIDSWNSTTSGDTTQYLRFVRNINESSGYTVAWFSQTGNLALSYNGGPTSANNDGTGITFPATQNASSNANCLDDYEEGTFTPTLIVDSGTPAYQYQEGRYTKIGRYVYGGGIIGITNSGSLTGGIAIQLPFAVLNTSYGMSAGVGTDGSGITWPVTGTGGHSIYNVAFQAQPNTVTLRWYSVSSSATYPEYTSANVNNTWYMRFNFGYFTS